MTRAQQMLVVTELLGVAGCAVASCTAATPTPADEDQMVAEAANAEYPLELSPTGRVRLVQGRYEELIAPDAAARLSVRLAEERAMGDLDADGKPEVALILIAQPGGTGTFSYLTVAHNRGRAIKPVAPLLLGDRVEVQSLHVQAGELTVKLLTRAPGEPMTAAPTTSQTRRFVLQGDTLVPR